MTKAKQQQAAINYQNFILAQSAVLMQELATDTTFFRYFYKLLPNCQSQREAFQVANLLHELLFGVEKYKSYDSFKKAKNRALKN